MATISAIDSARLAAVPELDRIAADPRCLAGLSRSAIAGLLARSAAVQSALTAALVTEDSSERPAAINQDDDRFLTVDEAAVMLRRSRQWIYRNKHRLPFVKRLSAKSLLCSEAGLKQWLASRKV
jgi:predicted DNA-binding transcriptional regulator AlpA